MIRQFELVERVKSYYPTVDEEALNRAYVFGMKVHGSQMRASGDPYFSHPLEVAGILADMKLDPATIITGLLHDVVEDTVATLEDIDTLFGDEVSRLVDGVTKLSRIELQSDQTRQAENFRKLVLAISQDIRVLLVKLSDRLHNMRTLHYIANPETRQRIARETTDIYAPLAERIGMQWVKDELEDLAFAELNAEARDSLVSRLEYLRKSDGGLVDRIVNELGEVLRDGHIESTVIGREKRPYSMWSKMQKKNVSLEQLSDVMAFRVIVETVEDCYTALGLIHQKYPVLPGRFKDYISTPKPNSYQSLHTGVIGPVRQRIEIQIRTREMDEVAEYGLAAHWLYKQGVEFREGRRYRWLQELLEILEHASGPEEFLEHTKLEMFKDQVFAFTPKGDLIALPRGATPVDFAYAVHSQIGDTCVGAKINGRLQPLHVPLANGDQVEIIRSSTQTPSPAWESFVVSGKARARIRRFIRSRRHNEYVELGKAIVNKVFREEGYEWNDDVAAKVLPHFKCETADDLFALLGEGAHTGNEVFRVAFPSHKGVSRWSKVVPLPRRAREPKDEGGIPIRGLSPGMAVHYASCCHPLPGDRIVGIVTTGKGVTIHTIDCETLESFNQYPERWLDVSWDAGAAADKVHVGRLSLVVANEPGSLGRLSTVIGNNMGNISNLRITNRSPDFFEMLVDVEVSDIRHLTDIMAALRATPAITSVARAGK